MTGHKQLIKYMSTQSRDVLNNSVLIEIGSTREFIPGHNSSEDFIIFCKKNNLKFISVDMDPECSQNVRNISKKHNFDNFEVHTQKGEIFLKEYDGNMDFIYLDAFDFYHNNHSQKRMNAYNKYNNQTITKDDYFCHKMHKDCCIEIINKNKKPVICFDDILDNNKKGKGVTAIPYLLENGYKLHEYNKSLHSMLLTT
jgi:hypothetical protein